MTTYLDETQVELVTVAYFREFGHAYASWAGHRVGAKGGSTDCLTRC